MAGSQPTCGNAVHMRREVPSVAVPLCACPSRRLSVRRISASGSLRPCALRRRRCSASLGVWPTSVLRGRSPKIQESTRSSLGLKTCRESASASAPATHTGNRAVARICANIPGRANNAVAASAVAATSSVIGDIQLARWGKPSALKPANHSAGSTISTAVRHPRKPKRQPRKIAIGMTRLDRSRLAVPTGMCKRVSRTSGPKTHSSDATGRARHSGGSPATDGSSVNARWISGHAAVQARTSGTARSQSECRVQIRTAALNR